MAEGGGGVLREILAVFGFNVDTKELEKGENKLEEFTGKLKTFATAIAGAFAVNELYEFAEANVHAMTAIEHSAAQIGISEEAVQSWQFAAKSAGFEADKFTNAMSRLQVAQQAAITGKGVNEFNALGVSVKDAAGHAKNADELFLDVAESIHKIEDPAKRAGAVTKLFGRAGRELIPFLDKGRKGIGELLKKYHELGGGYTKDAIEKTKEFEEAQAGLNSVWTRTKSTVLSALLPVLSKISEWATKAISWFNNLAKGSQIFKVALLALGAVGTYFAAQMLIAFAPVLLAAAAIGALVLILDDLFVLFSGGHSAIGDAIDKLFGKGQSAALVKEIKEEWAHLTDILKEAWGYVKKIWDGFVGMEKFLSEHGPGSWLGDYLGKKRQEADDERYDKAHPLSASTRARGGNGAYDVNGLQTGTGPAGLPLGMSGSPFSLDVVVNPPPGMDEHIARIHGESVGKEVHKVLKQHRRAAKATLPVATE